MGRYRFRTWLRQQLPWRFAERIPKGRDCGKHEWYWDGDGEWACYHCLVTTAHSPWTGSEWALYRLTAILKDMTVILQAENIPDDEIAAELESYQPEITRLLAFISDEPSERQGVLKSVLEQIEAPSQVGVAAGV